MTLADLERLGLHLAQDGPWNSVLIVLAPPCDCYRYDALA